VIRKLSIAIEFCQSNLSSGTDWVKDQLEADPNLDVEILDYGCLGNCGQCYLQPFAMVSGDIVAADSPEELLIKILDTVKQKLLEEEEWRKLGF
jgi:uncharacterized protein YuzB (UPF0349 family)